VVPAPVAPPPVAPAAPAVPVPVATKPFEWPADMAKLVEQPAAESITPVP